MKTIVPAVIPESRIHLIEMLEKISTFSKAVQIDIVDGIFVSALSWPYSDGGETPEEMKRLFEGFDIEVDLMVQNPEQVVEDYLRAGVTRVVIHLESTTQLDKIVALKDTYNFKLGLSILNDTDLSLLEAVIGVADYVQCMGIKDIGSQKQPFDARVLERVRFLREAYPHLEISIDGSVNTETLPQLCDAGAVRFAVGSAIVKSDDPHTAYQTLTKIIL